MNTRPAIPRPLARDVKTEAGHRCAIPTCRQPIGLQIHHIVDYAKVQEHTFDNLILLCANCHSRVTNGEIDTRSVKHYKANLSVLNYRYGDIERRVLEHFSLTGATELVMVGNHEFDLMYLVRDGILVQGRTFGVAIGGNEIKIGRAFSDNSLPKVDPSRSGRKYDQAVYHLTEDGKAFIATWVAANELA